MIDWVAQLSEEDFASLKWESSDPAKEINFMNMSNSSICYRAMMNYT